jgi:hypothetical protein
MSQLIPAALVRDAVERVALSARPHAPIRHDREHSPSALYTFIGTRLARWTAVRDELSDHRQERARYRALKRDLASFTTPAAVDDLLDTIQGQEDAEAEMIRSILAGNLQPQRTHRLAS